MKNKILEMLNGSIEEFDLYFNADKQGTIELTKTWIEKKFAGMIVSNKISTREELIIHTKGLALWFNIGTHKEGPTVIDRIVDTMGNKTNLNMKGLKHWVGTFQENNKEITEEDLIKVLFIVCIIKSGEFGRYGGAVTIEGLLVDNPVYGYLFVSKITEFSFYSGVNFRVLFDCLLLISLFEIHTYSLINIDEVEIEEQQKKNIQNILSQHSKNTVIDTYKSILQTVLKNYKKILEIKQKSSSSPKVHLPELSQEVLNNSYEAVKNSLNIDNVHSLPFDQYEINFKSVLEDVQEEKKAFDDLLTNPKRVGQLEAGNHFMGHILKDTLTIKDDKVIFQKYTEGLRIGYTQKAVVMSLDKESSLRELKSSLKVLEKYTCTDSEKLISFTNTLIEILTQKRYINMVPFKAIVKKSKITKNEAKRYARELDNRFTIRDTTFDNNFDDLKIHDFTK